MLFTSLQLRESERESVCMSPVSVLLWRSAQKERYEKVGVGDYVSERERERERGLFSNRGGKTASAIIVRGYI